MSEYIEFQEGKKYPSKNADRAKNPEAFKDAGYILNDEELVVDIDVLTRPSIEKLIHYFGIKTQIVWTDEGGHLYFKKPNGFKGNKIICPLGFEIEYKHAKNTPNGVTIKRNGKMREIMNAGIREDLPDIFAYKRGLKDLLGRDEGEGRNRDLFAHRMRIQQLGRWKTILRFINNEIFSTPLPEEEFLTISRDGIKPKAEKNNQPEIAKYLMDNYKVVSYIGLNYWRINGVYTADEKKINLLIGEEVPDEKTMFYKEVKNQLEYKAPVIDSSKDFDLQLKNGILRKGKFYGIDYQEFTPYTIDIPYFKNAAPVQAVIDYLDFLSSGNEVYKNRLLEVMAHPLIINRQFKRMLGRFFFLIGKGGNGKGTFLTVLENIYGSKNCSSLSIRQMADERYFCTMVGKLVNLGDDVEEEFISKDQIKMLKNVSTCDLMQVRRMREQSQDAYLTTSLIFTSNHMLKSREKGESYKRRVDWLPIMGVPAIKDADLIAKLSTPEALQYWLALLVEAYQRLYKNKAFTPCSIVDDFNSQYHLYNDNINQFLDDYPNKEDWVGMGKNNANMLYRQWCEENDELQAKQSKEKLFEKIKERFSLNFGKVNIMANGKVVSSTTAFYDVEKNIEEKLQNRLMKST